MDWVRWHRAYDVPDSYLARRLAMVQRRIRDWLDAQPAGRPRVVSLCAGEGRDLLGVLAGHPRGHDVDARLIELDPDNCAVARAAVERAGLDSVEVVLADASLSDACAGAVPADLVLACGIFGNVSDADVQNAIAALPSLCSHGAHVVWTRHRRAPDLTPSIRSWFQEAGFREVAFDAPDEFLFSVGMHRFTGAPAPFQPGVRLFRFVGFAAL
jgi:hypothetical protein